MPNRSDFWTAMADDAAARTEARGVLYVPDALAGSGGPLAGCPAHESAPPAARRFRLPAFLGLAIRSFQPPARRV